MCKLVLSATLLCLLLVVNIESLKMRKNPNQPQESAEMKDFKNKFTHLLDGIPTPNGSEEMNNNLYMMKWFSEGDHPPMETRKTPLVAALTNHAPLLADSIGCEISFRANISAGHTWIATGGSIRSQNDDNILLIGEVFRPKTEAEVIDIIHNSNCNEIAVSSSSFSPGYIRAPPSGKPTCMLTMWEFKDVTIDRCLSTIKIGAGVTVFDLAPTLISLNLTLNSYQAMKTMSIVGFLTVQGQAVWQNQRRASFGDKMIEMTVINGKGERKVITRESEAAKAWEIGIGDLGVVVDVTLRIEPDSLVCTTCYILNGSPDEDLTATELDHEFTFEEDNFAWIALYPESPNMLGCRVDERTFDLSDTACKGYDRAPTIDMDIRSTQFHRFRNNHRAFFNASDSLVENFLNANPQIQHQVWERFQGSPLPPLGARAKSAKVASKELISDLLTVRDQRANQSWDPGSRDESLLFGSLFVHPEQIRIVYKQFLKHRTCVKELEINNAMMGRGMSARWPTFLGHQFNGVEMFWVGTGKFALFEEWTKRFTCALRCTLNITTLEFHWAQVWPPEMLKLDGWDWVPKENVRKFKSIAAQEDPEDKFTNLLAKELGKKLLPQEHVCTYCKRQQPCDN